MDLKGLPHALLDTGKLSGIALFCVGTASAFGWLLAEILNLQLGRRVGKCLQSRGFSSSILNAAVHSFRDCEGKRTTWGPLGAAHGTQPCRYNLRNIGLFRPIENERRTFAAAWLPEGEELKSNILHVVAFALRPNP